jgi:hypothetical protein
MDLYAKFIFTVIACALSAIAYENFAMGPARAQLPPIAKVVICDATNFDRCASIDDKGWFVVETHPGS